MENQNSTINIAQVNKTANWVKLREEFVQNHNGTSMEEILLLTQFPAPMLFISVNLNFWLVNNMCNDNGERKGYFPRLAAFLLEFITLVIPFVLQLTMFADIPFVLSCYSITCSLIFIVFAVSSVNYDVLYWRIPHFKEKILELNLSTEKQLCVTYFRSFVFILSAISMLAVDFHIFPRRHAKTENYGVSIMDLGTGLYVMASAIVNKRNSANRKLKDVFRETLVYLNLGAIRCLLMQNIDYQKHVTEYGVHWNFFFTLGLVKLISSVFMKISRGHNLICGVLLLFLHQVLLSFALEEYVMSDWPRDNLMDANREGIVSLLGYISIHLIGESIKTLVYSVDMRTKKQTVKCKIKSIAFLIPIGVVLISTIKFLEPTFRMSRRLANVPYVLFTIVVCLEYIAFGLVFELVSICFLPIKPTRRQNIYNLLVPQLLKCVNDNGFIFFLSSNLLTGLVNLSIDVLSTEMTRSMLLLILYMFMNCVIVYTLHVHGIKIKFL